MIVNTGLASPIVLTDLAIFSLNSRWLEQLGACVRLLCEYIATGQYLVK